MGPNRRDPKGPVDREVGVIQVVDGEGHIIASLVNYACDPIALGSGNLLITADFPYYTRKALGVLYGGSVDVIFIQGACGDINPCLKERSFREAKRLGIMLGAEVVKIMENITLTNSYIKLGGISRTLDIQTKKVSSLDEARRNVKEKERRAQQIRQQGVSENEVLKADYDIEYAREVLIFAELGLKKVTTEVQVVRIGDSVLVGIPGELFVEYGLSIKRESPFKNTFVVGYANDYVGYLPTLKAFDEGGYEIGTCKLFPDAGQIMQDTALDLIAYVSQE